MTFRLCTVGCGSMSTNVHGPSYRKYATLHPDFVLVACCDLDGIKAEKYRLGFGFDKCYSDINLMLDTEKPDAVCLVVPEHLTAQISIQIMEKGYPLIMEKPPGLNKQETEMMILAADHNQIPTQVAFNRRYMPLVKELKHILNSQFVLSDIHHIRYDFYRVGRLDADFAATAANQGEL